MQRHVLLLVTYIFLFNLTFVFLDTVKSRRKISKRANVTTSLNRIRDVNVTKKSFQKWKPLSARTISFVEDAISSVIL